MAKKEEKSKEIIQAVINIAEIFDLELIAEGIESEEDIPLLVEMGCDMGQGYYFSRPVAPEEMLENLTQDKKVSAKQEKSVAAAE